MAVSAIQAAKRLCELSDWTLTNLKLQKILYMAHMFRLGRGDGPLINESFEAWDYGPVVPVIYHKVKAFGDRPIRNIFGGIPDIPEESPENENLVDAIDALLKVHTSKLVSITHSDIGAWAEHYEPYMQGIVIPNDDIKAEYDAWQKKAA